jgi:hypothetical protein
MLSLILLFLLSNGFCYSLVSQDSTEVIGDLDFVGYIVPNVSLNKNMLQLGTGNQFGSVTNISTKVKLSHTG